MGAFLEHLELKSELREQPFHSTVPVLGRLIAGFRRLWNNISTRWYVLPLMQQQNEYNALLLAECTGLEQRLIDLDRDQVELLRALAETQVQVIQLRRQLDALQNSSRQDLAKEA